MNNFVSKNIFDRNMFASCALMLIEFSTLVMAFYPDLIPVNYFIGKKILSRVYKVTHVELFYHLMGKEIFPFSIHISDSTSITTIIQGNTKTVCHGKSISLVCTVLAVLASLYILLSLLVLHFSF